MLLASYVAIRPGLQGIGNRAIRYRLDTIHSHSEMVFQPGDGVDHLMPDGTTEPINGEYWCASSVFAERMPEFCPNRPGELGGIRFKRINVKTPKWINVPIDSSFALGSAQWFKDHQGMGYDYLLIAKYVLWVLPSNKDDRAMCSESCAASMGFKEAERIDPALLFNIVSFLRQNPGITAQAIKEMNALQIPTV